MAEGPQTIALSKLDIDPENIRGVEWNPNDEADRELVESVEKKGILNPLLVRPAPEGYDAEYTIIGGGRRYNAAIDAGLDSVPCTVRDVDDITAAGLSAIENRDRSDVPTYRVAFKAIEKYHRLNGEKGRQEKVETLADKFGCSERAMREYLELDNLPSTLQDLVKAPEKWSEETRQAVAEHSKFDLEMPDRGLSVRKASKIARELFERSEQGSGTPIKKQSDIIQFAAEAIGHDETEVYRTAELLSEHRHKNIPVDDAWRVADLVQSHDIEVDEALDFVEGRTQEIPTDISVRITLPSQFEPVLQEATEDRQKSKDELIKYYIQEGLREDGYL